VRILTFVIFVASATAIAGAQKTAASTAPAAASTAPAAVPASATAPTPDTTPKPAAPESYSYDPAGRRDPFLNLLGTGSGPTSRKGEGPSGIAVAEISVRGVLQSRNGLIAMVQGPDNKTYIVHQGDKLLDGTIKSVTPQGLVFVQEVNDPLSLIKTREVRKLLRSLEDAK
jgi:Tfp pilus assembly protein PilP